MNLVPVMASFHSFTCTNKNIIISKTVFPSNLFLLTQVLLVHNLLYASRYNRITPILQKLQCLAFGLLSMLKTASLAYNFLQTGYTKYYDAIYLSPLVDIPLVSG